MMKWVFGPAVFAAGLSVAASEIRATDVALPELVEVESGTFQYRLSGEFLKNGYPVDAPRRTVKFSRPFQIMKYQVSASGYTRCVAEGACARPFKGLDPANDRPATGVSFIDAQDYAEWLTAKTSVAWRLPRDDEWAYIAASRFADDALGARADLDDPSARVRLKYRQSTLSAGEADTGNHRIVKERGHYGANKNGIVDLSGNVWEWTSTCYSRSKILKSGEVITPNGPNCGVRVVEGAHRAYMPVFIQDAKSGGCSVGAPPDYLGFRLIRDDPPYFSARRLRNWWSNLTGR